MHRLKQKHGSICYKKNPTNDAQTMKTNLYAPLLGFVLLGCTAPKPTPPQITKPRFALAERIEVAPSIKSRVCVVLSPGAGPFWAWDTTRQCRVDRWVVLEASTNLVDWTDIARDTNAIIVWRTNTSEFYRGRTEFK